VAAAYLLASGAATGDQAVYISRIVIRNFRNFEHLDIELEPGVTCIVGENNTGKTNLLHAIRLPLDINLSSQYRLLTEHDIHSAVDISKPQQVLVSVEFSDYSDNENECALVGAWEVDNGRARITYRFRPNQSVRDDIEAEEHPGTGLTLEDYRYEFVGGGKNDPAEVEWNEELGSSARFPDLQAFQVVFLQALRDVQQDLRSLRTSPLARLIAGSDIPEAEKTRLVEILRNANSEVAKTETIANAGSAIEKAFTATAGDAFEMAVRLGIVDPTFASILRSLTLLLSNEALEDFGPERNGLGINNLLYVSILLELFARRVAASKTAGQLLLIEEPEAHLHPQLQRVLYNALAEKGFQAILTTHSTHVASLAPLRSLITLTNRGVPAIASSAVLQAQLEDEEIADLERYLDATRSTLLFARRVMLVEGPAELFLIPAMAGAVMGVQFDRLGISIIPIFGVHFRVYAKLFGENLLPKKCAIVADGDLKPSDCADDVEPLEEDFSDLENGYVKVFRCKTTFERALVFADNLEMFRATAKDLGTTTLKDELVEAQKLLQDKGKISDKQRTALANSVLSAAKRIGKARFSQVASKHASLARSLPTYIREAINWLVAD